MRYTPVYSSYFKFIRDTFGYHVVRLLKQWIIYNKEIIKTNLRNKYLIGCKRSHVLPKHLNNYHLHNIVFHNDTFKTQALIYTKLFTKNLLNLEIRDNFKKHICLISQLFSITRNIEKNLPLYICKKFFNTQNHALYKLYLHENHRLYNKLKAIQLFDNSNNYKMENIDNIKYYWSMPSQNKTTDYNLSFTKHDFHTDDSIHSVELNPTDHNEKTKNVLEPRKKWFLNASNTEIPNDVVGLLQLGENFCLPPTNKNDSITQCIKHIESSFSRLQNNNCINKFRNQIFPFINSLNNIDKSRTDIDSTLITATQTTKKFIKNNPEVLFTRADKGNTVVALDRTDYISKMENSLSDTNTYTVIPRNPANKLLNNLKDLLKHWLNSNYISPQTHRYLNASNPILPRAYGLPKIHKEGLPLRIIVSSVGSPLHNLATFLQKIL